MDDLSRSCCPNSECPDYSARGGENLSVRGRYGKGNSIRSSVVGLAGGHSSERESTPQFYSHLSREKAEAVAGHIAEGRGVRGAARQ